MQEEKLAQTSVVFSKQETNVCTCIWAPLLSLSWDKGQTNTPGPNTKHRALPGHTAPHSPRALCCCSPAIPGAQDGKELHSGQCIHPEENAALPLLCAGLGSIPFAPEEQTKIIQALQALHSSPCRQMFSCCVLCVCTGEPEAFESSQLCSRLIQGQDKLWVCTEEQWGAEEQLPPPGREPQGRGGPGGSSTAALGPLSRASQSGEL